MPKHVMVVEVLSQRPFRFVSADIASALREAGFYGIAITGGEPHASERELLRKERDEIAEWATGLRRRFKEVAREWAEGPGKEHLREDGATQGALSSLLEALDEPFKS